MSAVRYKYMKNKYSYLVDKALKLRQSTFKAFYEHGEAHLGGSFSIVETLIALYEVVLKTQDKFILSKAHASFPLCLLLKDRGLNPQLGTHLELDPKNGIFATTGSLGHGLPIAVGMALARKLLGVDGNIFVMISDGECQEGTTWESALIAADHKLDNLQVIIDNNKIQALSKVEDVLPLGDLSAKFKAFGWSCVEVFDGHSFDELLPALQEKITQNQPKVYLLNTIKGKGIQFFENNPEWHAKKIKDIEYSIGAKALGLI